METGVGDKKNIMLKASYNIEIRDYTYMYIVVTSYQTHVI